MGLPLSLLAIYLYFCRDQNSPRHSKPSTVYQKPKTRTRSGKNHCLEVSFCHNILSRETAGARPSNSTPGAPAKRWMWTRAQIPFTFTKFGQKVIDHSTIHSAYLRGGSPFTVKLKSTYRAHPRRKLCTFHFHKIGPRTHRSNWDAFRRVTFLWETER